MKTSDRIGTIQEYYFSKKLLEIAEMEKETGEKVLNLGIGSPDLPPHPDVISTLMVSANRPANHGYQSYRGLIEFRQAIEQFSLRNYQITLDPKTEILPLLGSKEGIMHISMAFLNDGDEVLVPNPGYPAYSNAAELAGATVKSYDLLPENKWKIDVDNILSKITSKTKIIWLTNPHMPTGSVTDINVLKPLVDFANDNDILLVNDNAYSLVLNETPTSLLSIEGAMNCCLELNTLSKSHHLAGWRAGWMSGKSEFIDAVLKFKSNMDSGMFKGIQEASVVALSIDIEWHKEQNAQYEMRKIKIEELMELLDCKVCESDAGLFVWARIPDNFRNGDAFINYVLKKHRFFISPGHIFGSNGDKYVRASLCSPVAMIEEAKARIVQETELTLS